jgi:L,D-peptidoglycan transpeptidase YkuD (ErfK/YbiS/YcfS/YnhG family)
MLIILKNKDTLVCDNFEFKCSIGQRGSTFKKKEGDKKTPKGSFSIGPLFIRKDRNNVPKTKLKIIKINKNMGWCDDENHQKYNQLIDINKNIKCEKLFRRDYKYDFFMPIKYNTSKPKKNKGSAIFLHLTKDYKKTLGCIALKKKDFLILIKLIDKKTKIKII